LFENEKSGENIINRWNDLTAKGKVEGFYPLLVFPNDILTETLEMALEYADLEISKDGFAAYRESVLREAEGIGAQVFLAKKLSEYMEAYGDDILGHFQPTEPAYGFYFLMDGQMPFPELIIAKIPAKNPWELAAWLPMGGFNSCPTPSEQVAVFQRWHEKYGAVPAFVTHDVWELELSKPPLTENEAEELAKEQFSFCDDCVVQASKGWNTIRARASALKGSTAWHFWWE
jgi:hypothetical protein